MRASLQHRLVAVEWAQKQQTFPSDVVVKACTCLWLWRKFSWLAKVTLVLYGFDMFCPTYEKPRSPGAQARHSMILCSKDQTRDICTGCWTTVANWLRCLLRGCAACRKDGGWLDATFWVDILCWQHSLIYNILQHNHTWGMVSSVYTYFIYIHIFIHIIIRVYT